MTGKCLWDSRKGSESVTLGHSTTAINGAYVAANPADSSSLRIG
jgi:hypothetical protein